MSCSIWLKAPNQKIFCLLSYHFIFFYWNRLIVSLIIIIGLFNKQQIKWKYQAFFNWRTFNIHFPAPNSISYSIDFNSDVLHRCEEHDLKSPSFQKGLYLGVYKISCLHVNLWWDKCFSHTVMLKYIISPGRVLSPIPGTASIPHSSYHHHQKKTPLLW